MHEQVTITYHTISLLEKESALAFSVFQIFSIQFPETESLGQTMNISMVLDPFWGMPLFIQPVMTLFPHLGTPPPSPSPLQPCGSWGTSVI